LKTYEILNEGRSIMCLRCGLVSYHPKDVEEKYCGNCHIFHQIEEQLDKLRVFREAAKRNGLL